MKSKTLLITSILFFLLINTSYYWEVELGIFDMLASLILFLVFIGLAIALVFQLCFAYSERFKSKQRLFTLAILTMVLTLTFFKPFGFIDFDRLKGEDLLIAKRVGAVNCMTTFKLKENNKFSERISCFGMTETTGNYIFRNDTIYFENVKQGRDQNEFYKFAVIKRSRFSWNKDGYELFRYKDDKDTAGHYLTITMNGLSKPKNIR